MSIERTATGHRVRWRDGTKNRSRAFKALKAAEAFERHVDDLKAAGRLHELDQKPAGETVLRDYVRDVWWPDYAVPRLVESTQLNYAAQWDLRIEPMWGDKRLRDIKPGALQAWVTKLQEQGVGDPTIIKTLTVLQAIMTRAHKDEEIPSNPVKAVDKPSTARTRELVAVSPLMVERIRAFMLSPEPTVDRRGIPHPRANEQLRHRNATLVSVLAYAGPRPESEALPLKWDQVGARALTLPPSRKRGGRQRYVDLLEPLAEDLSEYWQYQGMPGKDQRVFGAWSKGTWDYWREHVFKPAAVQAGLPRDVVPRDLRGSFGSLLIADGRLSILEIARQLGHKPSMLLDTYGRLFSEQDRVGHGRPAADVIREARQLVEGERVHA